MICLWQVGFNKSGKVLALDCKLYNNAGNSLDLSAAIMDRALLHTDAAYKIPHVRVVGHCCKTNIASNTAFRGFGGPQVCLCAETLVLMMADSAACSFGSVYMGRSEGGGQAQGMEGEARSHSGRDGPTRGGGSGSFICA